MRRKTDVSTADFAEGLRDDYPDTAHVFTDMAREEDEHRRILIDTYTERFGTHIPLIRRQDVRGYRAATRNLAAPAASGWTPYAATPGRWRTTPPAFICEAAGRATDTAVRRLLGDLAAAEAQHETHGRRPSRRKRLPGERPRARG